MGKRRYLAVLTVLSMLATMLSPAASLATFSGISADFTAAAPSNYNHVTGGGAFDDRTSGTDVVKSWEAILRAGISSITAISRRSIPQGSPQAQSTARVDHS